MVDNGVKPRAGIANLEKRRYPRFTVNLPIEYYQIDSSINHTGRTINASEGGLLVYLLEQLEIGQHLKIKLFFSSGSDLNTIEMIAEVVWKDIQLDEGWGNYRYGVRFTHISSEDMRRFKTLLENLSK